jgi:hypothetical protein
MSLSYSSGIRLAMDAYRCLNMTFGVPDPGRLQPVATVALGTRDADPRRPNLTAEPGPGLPSGGTYTLAPGTYYGGVCIGLPSGTACNTTNCTSGGIGASVTLAAGTYVMAGGGFWVCGAAS